MLNPHMWRPAHQLLTNCSGEQETASLRGRAAHLGPAYTQGLVFPQRLGNIDNENGHGKVMEHEEIAKSHGIWLYHSPFSWVAKIGSTSEAVFRPQYTLSYHTDGGPRDLMS